MYVLGLIYFFGKPNLLSAETLCSFNTKSDWKSHKNILASITLFDLFITWFSLILRTQF